MNEDSKQNKSISSLSILNIVFYALLVIIIGLSIYLIIPKGSKTSNKNILLENNVAIRIGETHKIKIDSDINANISYTVDDPSIATVSNDGIITGINFGKTIITIKTDDKEEKCTVFIREIDIESITLDKENIQMKVGETTKLNITITPENAVDTNIKWTSNNSNIVDVNEGTITAKSSGNTTVIASTNNGKIAICNVIVEELFTPTPVPTPSDIKIQEIKLNYDNVSLNINDKIELKATIIPSNATNTKLIWSSNNTKVATVDEFGKVIAKEKGKTIITVKSENGITGKVIITVQSNTYNKTAIFFGDSITMGANNYSFTNYISKKYDFKNIVNAGISGGFISLFTQERWILNVVKKYAGKKYDYVIMQGGINDTAVPMALGSYSSNNFSGNYDSATFLGGLETYIYTVKKQWPKAKLGYIITYKTPLDAKVSQNSTEYYSKMMKVLQKWKVSYINLYSGKTSNGVKYSDLLKVNTKTYIFDGNHLNKKGNNLIAPHIYEWISKL